MQISASNFAEHNSWPWSTAGSPRAWTRPLCRPPRLSYTRSRPQPGQTVRRLA